MSMIGKTLGTFTLEAQIGKGGMGEVYKAKDQKLGRDVAIKVLPEEFAKDADREARFQREAKLLASLNHSNIAAIYGLEESDGTHFLVLELIEGDTLADRLKRGAIAVEEALKLALQIAEAIEAAHEKGVIHRDLKPANIKVTPEGKVKVLDFGLAKAFLGDQEDLNLSNSPTLSAAATQQGIILGTAAYMSPEQARGKPVDKRTDIWAFGVVLYEMLTGQSAFQGEDVSVTLASVIKGDTNLNLLPPSIHPRVREAITRCLQNDIRRRYSSIADARYEIEQALSDPSGLFAQPSATAKPRKKLRVGLPWVAAAVGLAAVAVWMLKPAPPPELKQVTRFEYELPDGQQIMAPGNPLLAISPDGSGFVYCTGEGLYLRSMDGLDARLISSAEELPLHPFFSPDGLWVGYWSQANRQLKKVAISGGAPVTICDAISPRRPIWNVDGTIVYVQDKGIMEISANGGTSELLVADEGKPIFAPQILPDGKSVLFSIIDGGKNQIAVQSLQSGERKILAEGINALYLPTGHLVYGLGNNLLAVPFDLDTLELAGGPVPMVEGILWTGGTAAPQYAVSDSGTLVFMQPTMASTAPQRTLVWVDRKGIGEPITAPPNLYRHPNISHDGTRVALAVSSGEDFDIWVWDLIRKTLTRLTFEAPLNVMPVWTPDDTRIAFFSGGQDGSTSGVGIYWKAADGTGKDEELCSLAEGYFFPYCWSHDGKNLVGAAAGAASGFDIGLLSMEGDHTLKTLLQENYSENQPKISTDGRWVAYTSDESRRNEVYVRSFPDVNKGRWQVSTNGGDSPLWSPDGRELFYRSGDAIMAVSVKTEPSFSIVGTPQILFQGTYVQTSGQESTPWDISPDGKRFLMIKEPEISAAAGPQPKINIVLNWFEELKDRIPAD
jgi:serine/threonine protein kinase/Tol biopolymer transport system component